MRSGTYLRFYLRLSHLAAKKWSFTSAVAYDGECKVWTSVSGPPRAHDDVIVASALWFIFGFTFPPQSIVSGSMMGSLGTPTSKIVVTGIHNPSQCYSPRRFWKYSIKHFFCLGPLSAIMSVFMRSIYQGDTDSNGGQPRDHSDNLDKVAVF